MVKQPQVLRQGIGRRFDEKYHLPVQLHFPLDLGKIVEPVGGDQRILAVARVMHFKRPLLLHFESLFGDETASRKAMS